MEQSLDIMKWAWKNPIISQSHIQIIIENDTVFKEALNRYKYPHRYAQHNAERIMMLGRHAGEQFIQNLENQLDLFCTVSNPLFVEIALFPLIRQFVMVDVDWFSAQPYPRLQKWLNMFIKNTLFNQIMQSYNIWSADHQPKIIQFKI